MIHSSWVSVNDHTHTHTARSSAIAKPSSHRDSSLPPPETKESMERRAQHSLEDPGAATSCPGETTEEQRWGDPKPSGAEW